MSHKRWSRHQEWTRFAGLCLLHGIPRSPSSIVLRSGKICFLSQSRALCDSAAQVRATEKRLGKYRRGPRVRTREKLPGHRTPIPRIDRDRIADRAPAKRLGVRGILHVPVKFQVDGPHAVLSASWATEKCSMRILFSATAGAAPAHRAK